MREQLLETLEKDMDQSSISSLIERADGGSGGGILVDDRG